MGHLQLRGIAIKKDGGRDGIMFMTDHANEQVMKVSMKDGTSWRGGVPRDRGPANSIGPMTSPWTRKARFTSLILMVKRFRSS